jgi:hypothetical protein
MRVGDLWRSGLRHHDVRVDTMILILMLSVIVSVMIVRGPDCVP